MKKCSSFVTGISANGQTIAPVVHFLHETTIKKKLLQRSLQTVRKA